MLISGSEIYAFRAILLLLILFSSGNTYNLDTQFPIIYTGSRGDYFGYSTALHKNRWGPVALIGAARSNTTTLNTTVYQPGTVFRCNITENKVRHACQEIFLMTEGATETRRNYDSEYTDKKDGMWLGVSLDVRPVQTENDIVTCGHLWKNQYHPKLHLVNGVCYVINGDLDNVRRLLPLTVTSRQYGHVRGRAQEYNYAHGQAGMSAVFSQNGSNLILGAPGIWSWTGSIVNYNVKSPRRSLTYSNPNIPPPAYEINYNSYFGYSVTTGRFFQAKMEFYAAGAPRDGTNYGGKVYIFSLERGQMRIRSKKQGVQLGEYFGASVLGVNLNGDSFTDLVVGAPLNSMESAGDEGKVYVYISNGNDLQRYTELTGDRKENARFGTALASIGDIDQDGFNDIAIGAPYEDGTGAVYIYHGSRSGINSVYAQKIEASSINSQMSGFGIHISRGLDIDNNGYPDILVGSYNSSNAVLMRTRRMIQVYPEIVFMPKQILMNQTSCQLRGQNLTCVQVDACLSYTGKHVPAVLAFQFDVTVKDSRGYFDQDSEQSPTAQERIVLEINQKLCSSFWVYLRPGIKDTIRPISVEFSHQLVLPSDSKTKFDETFPIYHPSSLSNITSDITFMTGCAQEDECHSDLVVNIKRTEPAEGALITLGTVSRVSVSIIVKNTGEPAYLSELLIYLPPEMPSINQDICETVHQTNNASLVCHLGNPLENNGQTEINIKLDTTKIPPHTKYLEMACQVVSLSNETNPDDNIETLPFHLKTVSDIGITGFSLQEQIMHNGTQKMSSTITHNYIVRNHGPSPLEKIDILLSVPYVFLRPEGQEPFVHFKGLEVDNGMQQTVPATCEDASVNIINSQRPWKEEGKTIIEDPLLIKNERKDSTAFVSKNDIFPPKDMTTSSDAKPDVDKENNGNVTSETSITRGHFIISCDTPNIECVTFRCSASPFSDRRKFAQLSISFQLDFSILNTNLEQWYQIEFATTGSISVPDKAVIQLHHLPEIAQIQTVILQEGLPPAGKISPWIIFVSISIGVFCLLIILLIFIKIGFFKRSEKAKMKELLENEEGHEETVEQEISDTEVLQQIEK